MATKIGAAKVKILKSAGTSTYTNFRRPPPPVHGLRMSLTTGVPGSGKSTFATMRCLHHDLWSLATLHSLNTLWQPTDNFPLPTWMIHNSKYTQFQISNLYRSQKISYFISWLMIWYLFSLSRNHRFLSSSFHVESPFFKGQLAEPSEWIHIRNLIWKRDSMLFNIL